MWIKSLTGAMVVGMGMTVWTVQPASADPTLDIQRKTLWAIHDSHGEVVKDLSGQEVAMVRLAMNDLSTNQHTTQMTSVIQRLSSKRMAQTWRRELSGITGLTSNDGRKSSSVSRDTHARARAAGLSGRASLVSLQRSLAAAGPSSLSLVSAGPSNLSGANTNATFTGSINPSGLNTFALISFNTFATDVTFDPTIFFSTEPTLTTSTPGVLQGARVNPGSIVSGNTITSGSITLTGGSVTNVSNLTLPASCKITSHSVIDCSQP